MFCLHVLKREHALDGSTRVGRAVRRLIQAVISDTSSAKTVDDAGWYGPLYKKLYCGLPPSATVAIPKGEVQPRTRSMLREPNAASHFCGVHFRSGNRNYDLHRNPLLRAGEAMLVCLAWFGALLLVSGRER